MRRQRNLRTKESHSSKADERMSQTWSGEFQGTLKFKSRFIWGVEGVVLLREGLSRRSPPHLSSALLDASLLLFSRYHQPKMFPTPPFSSSLWAWVSPGFPSPQISSPTKQSSGFLLTHSVAGPLRMGTLWKGPRGEGPMSPRGTWQYPSELACDHRSLGFNALSPLWLTYNLYPQSPVARPPSSSLKLSNLLAAYIGVCLVFSQYKELMSLDDGTDRRALALLVCSWFNP